MLQATSALRRIYASGDSPQNPTTHQGAKSAPLRPQTRRRSVTHFANPRHTVEQFSGAQGPRLKESLCAPPKYALNERSLPLGLEKESNLFERM